MYQIFYIDIDEEITSVIDRLKKSKTTENFFVVSPRSLILQSVVSLKLLKREAAREKKQIAIIVNDKTAETKIEKAGILVMTSLKGLEGGEEVKESFGSKMEIKESIDNKNKYKNVMEKEKSTKKTRLQKIGSDDFYTEENVVQKNKIPEVPPRVKTRSARTKTSPENTVIIPKGIESSRSRNISDISNMPNIDLKKEKKSEMFSYEPETNFSEAPSVLKPTTSEMYKEYGPNRISETMDPYKEKVVEGFFNPEMRKNGFSSQNNLSEYKPKEEISMPGKMKKIIMSFAVICIIILAGIAAYIFLPKATVAISTKSEIKKFDLDIKGSSSELSVDVNDLAIPAKVIEKEDTITNSYKATGSKNSSASNSQKAKGKITIYNEFNSEPQSLVATTRFLTGDGKLFRLVKGVTIPGMTGSEPGKIEADVIADQAGESYNIGSSDFKIPGFEGTSKYDKFYAKSGAAMTGGGSGNSDGIAIVSQSDLENAKKDSENKLKEKLVQDIKDEIGSENVILADSTEKNIAESNSLSRINEVVSNFDYKVKGNAKAVVFSENDLKKLVAEYYNDLGKGSEVKDYSLIKINYGASSADLSAGTINIKINAEISQSTNVDWNDFKKKILGKNEAEIKEVLREYPQIEKININFWPSFISQKIPQYEKRVVIDVENGSN